MLTALKSLSFLLFQNSLDSGIFLATVEALKVVFAHVEASSRPSFSSTARLNFLSESVLDQKGQACKTGSTQEWSALTRAHPISSYLARKEILQKSIAAASGASDTHTTRHDCSHFKKNDIGLVEASTLVSIVMVTVS